MSLALGRNVVKHMCMVEGIEVADLMTGQRTRTITTARRRIALELRRVTNLSWREIGMLTGLRNPRERDFHRKG